MQWLVTSTSTQHSALSIQPKPKGRRKPPFWFVEIKSSVSVRISGLRFPSFETAKGGAPGDQRESKRSLFYGVIPTDPFTLSFRPRRMICLQIILPSGGTLCFPNEFHATRNRRCSPHDSVVTSLAWPIANRSPWETRFAFSKPTWPRASSTTTASNPFSSTRTWVACLAGTSSAVQALTRSPP